MSESLGVRLYALSNADSLGYLGQQAVADAAGEADYRIVGGHMVRLLLQVYPSPAATLRSTLDADAAVGDVEVVAPLSKGLLAQDFVKEGGNVFVKMLDADQRVEINLLLARRGRSQGIRPEDVPGIGQVDSLPELSFVLASPGLLVAVTAELRNGEVIEYTIRIPDVEAAVVLKAHSWRGRRSENDLADLHSLLEIRDAHPETAWRLGDESLKGFRKDTALIFHQPAEQVVRRHLRVPDYLDRLRMAALITRHIARP